MRNSIRPPERGHKKCQSEKCQTLKSQSEKCQTLRSQSRWGVYVKVSLSFERISLWHQSVSHFAICHWTHFDFFLFGKTHFVLRRFVIRRFVLRMFVIRHFDLLSSGVVSNDQKQNSDSSSHAFLVIYEREWFRRSTHSFFALFELHCES